MDATSLNLVALGLIYWILLGVTAVVWLFTRRKGSWLGKYIKPASQVGAMWVLGLLGLVAVTLGGLGLWLK
jgi:hypothetical protein